MKLSRSIVGEAEAAAVHRILCEEGYLGIGTEVQRFEQDLAAYLGVPASSVVSTNTGTAALHLAVQAVLGHDSKAEVLVPSLTFVASFQAISGAGATPVACDVRLDTATIDLKDAARRITPKTKAIMPVHYASNPVDLEEVYRFARQYGLRVIEDAAHAFGCRYKQKKIGSFGDIICFSFDGIKNITCGEGGCIVTVDQHIAELCRDSRLLSVEKDTEKRFAGGRSWDFEVERQGWRYHMSNIMAAIGRVQLGRLESEFGPKRRQLAALYTRFLSDVSGVRLLHQESEAWIIPHIFPVRILRGRKSVVHEQLEAAGIPTGNHYKPNHLLKIYGGGKERLPVTEQLYDELLTLPLHPGLEQPDIETICRALAHILATG